MNRDSLSFHLIGSQSSEQFTAAFFMGLLGLLGSVIVQLIKSKEKIKTSGGFSVLHWLEDNSLRTLLSFLIILIGAAQGELITGYVGDFGNLGLGFMTDKAIEALLALKNINPFKKK